MRFEVLTLFPEIIDAAVEFSILKRAKEKGIINIKAINPRDYSKDKHRKVDDTPYGGGAGMLLACQPYVDAYDSIDKAESSKTIILSPRGKIYNQETAKELAGYEQIIIISGHYEGFDERITEITGGEEISAGDYVMTGGEYPALCIIDSITRLQKGVLGAEESIEDDSHYEGLLEYPQYTKPREYKGLKVPEILLSGDHEKIRDWRRKEQFRITKNKRPDLYKKYIETKLNDYDKKIIENNKI